MRFLERTREPLQQNPGSGNGDSGESLTQARQDADRMLSVGDDAIRRALSAGNSEGFLRSVMQRGGE
jgi:hypothetical protein